MRTDDFDYNLPEELIAQEPAAVRDECRLLVMDRETGALEDRIFNDITENLRPGDLPRGQRDARHAGAPARRQAGHGRGGRGAPAGATRGGPSRARTAAALLGGARAAGQAPEAGRGRARVDFHRCGGRGGACRPRSSTVGPRRPAAASAWRGSRRPCRRCDEALHAVGRHAAAALHPATTPATRSCTRRCTRRRESSAAAPTAGAALHFTPETASSACARSGAFRLGDRGAGSGSGHLPRGGRVTTSEKHHVIDDRVCTP